MEEAMKQMICPKCFVPFPVEGSAYVCVNAGCQTAGSQMAATDALRDTKDRPVCPTCRGVLSVRACPHCGFEISDTATAEEMLTLSVIGAERSGKSNYLSVLINSIKNDMGGMYNCVLHPSGGDVTIRQYETQYYHPLFEQGECITATEQETVQPLIYSLVFGGDRHGITSNLTFYDACGSNFDSLSTLSDYNRSIYNSQGIIFLIDPLQLASVRQALGVEDGVHRVDPITLLARTIQLVRDGNVKNVRDKITIPIAVCLSKLDLLRHQLDPSSFLRYESRQLRQPGFDTVDFRSCDREVQSLLENWGCEELVNQVRTQFSDYGFFGFSALGQAPSQSNQVERVAPHRVCDPFLWLLQKNHVIQLA